MTARGKFNMHIILLQPDIYSLLRNLGGTGVCHNKQSLLMRFKVLMTVCMILVLSWVLTPCGFEVNAKVLEKHAISTFRAEVIKLGSRRFM
jgi:hypothetical protein